MRVHDPYVEHWYELEAQDKVGIFLLGEQVAAAFFGADNPPVFHAVAGTFAAHQLPAVQGFSVEKGGEARLVGGIIALAEALDVGITAEGVETAEQADLLIELGCDRAQGYLYSRAVPAASIDATRSRNPSTATAARSDPRVGK